MNSRGTWQTLKRKLRWDRLYRATSYLKSALWTVPLFAIAIVFAVAPLLRILDAWLDWKLTEIAPAGAAGLYQTVITLTLSFIVFTFGSLLVAIQVAGGQLTPRIIATLLLRDNVVRYSVGLFVFTLVFAVMALNRVEAAVHQLVAMLTATLGVACIAVFLFLIDYAARLLRPVSVVASVGDEGVEVIRSVYPARTADVIVDARPLRSQLGVPARTILHNAKAGIVLAVDLKTLVKLASRHGGVVEVVPQVGDFVAADDPLFDLYGGTAAIDDASLRATVAMGAERTLEQDPMFAFRILVDIALKALSPAINDPTTAVLAIDQVHRLLRFLGKHQLRGEVVCDDAGLARVIFRTPNWEDFVHLACREIRACGASNLQVARRMRALLEDVGRVLPEHRRPWIDAELELLDRAVELSYSNPEDRVLARLPDVQGLGGTPPAHRG
ncbi:MAG TPA: DUF2254 domain-containing protein [Casimicrobiaceae bacterium]